MTPNFWNDFNQFLVAAQEVIDEYWIMSKFDPERKPDLDWSEGKRYVKVFREGSVHCFVDKTNGNILKAASWKAPAKHARGNIGDPDNGQSAMGPHGANYLR